MKFFHTSAVIILAFFNPAVHAGCYTGGEVGDSANAMSRLRTTCQIAAPHMAGTYGPGEVRQYCLDQGSVRYNFEIQNLKRDGSQWMDPNGCYDFLAREIGCTYGGERTYPELQWYFKADPNRGSC
ncbi:hypothetical protein B0O99DRAFT_746543 [Bisporella sp. PMI_857]|nr:hypothetical protein B0O99DRAFT_746543 [Bisporella sp. PMI_857]